MTCLRLLLVLALVSLTGTAACQEPMGDAGVYPAREAALEKARAAADRGDHAAAIVELRGAAELAAGDREALSRIQYRLGNTYRRLERHEEALEAYSEGLSAAGSARTALASKLLNAQGISYRRLGRYAEAVDSFKQSIALRQRLGNALDIATAQANLGSIYQLQGRYAKALAAYREALASAEGDDDAPSLLKVALLTDVGLVLSELARYDDALDAYGEALALLDGGGQSARAGRLLHNMGFAYFKRGEVERSVETYSRALDLRRAAGDRRGEGKTLNNLGFAQTQLGRYEQALENLNAALAIARELGDKATEGRTLDSIATAYMKTGRHEKALKRFHEALTVKRDVGDLGGEHVTLANIARVHLAEGRPSVAILYLKQSVNVTERIRGELAALPIETRRSYAESVSRTYHMLADLLIEAGRLPEAQQVLAMLKEEEYREFIRRDAGPEDRHTRAAYSAFEQEQLARVEAARRPLAALGEELRALERVHPLDRSEAQKARIDDLRAELDRAHRRFQEALERLIAAFAEIERTARREELAVKQLDNDLRGLVRELSELTGKGVGLVHYVVLEDSLRILFTSPEVRVAQTVAIGEDDLNRQIQALRAALQNPLTDVRPAAHALYRRLIEPVQRELEGGGVEHLMIYLDRALRYLPLAALYDGERYLAEDYSLSVYTAAAERNLKDKPDPAWSIAGLGLSKGKGGFDPLEAVPAELDGIVKQGEEDPDGVLRGVIRLDDDFTQQVFKDSLRDGYQVMHLASHFVFKPGTENDSFLLLGDGSELDLGELRRGNYVFGRVELLTLSACETAVGGQGAEGQEVEGLATLTQKKGAKGVLATLWPVADASTGRFMRLFYELRAEQGLTKAEALRSAQLAFLSGEVLDKGGGMPARGARVVSSGDGPTASPAEGYRHPYYWAPFILMGNWL